ncbi:ERVV2 protein, partial [Ceuthmochares aereus]|nr:ERVV2 protein [Ceuthmochares aereus]
IRFLSFARLFILWLRVSELEKAIINVSAELENIENQTLDAFRAVKEETSQVSRVAVQKLMALDLLLASQGGVCTVVNTSCYVYVDQLGRIETDL